MFARLEALLVFVATLLVCNKVPALTAVLDDLSFAEAVKLGIPQPVLFWGALAFLVAGPYLSLLIVADRLLCIRNGFAWLSALAIAIWAGVALILAPDLAALLPTDWTIGTARISVAGVAAIAAASLTVLIHARPLWLGLHDRGVAPIQRAAQPNPNPWIVASPQPGPDQPSPNVLRALIVPAIGLALVFVILAAGWLQYGKSTLAVLGLNNPASHLPVVVTSGGEATAWRRLNGSFGVDAIVNAHPIAMTFDTGASFVALRAEDAAQLGMTTYSLAFTLKVRTANGIASVAPVTLDTLKVGSITMSNVQAVVAQPGAMSESLLGQSFLGRLRDYKVERNTVTFRGQ